MSQSLHSITEKAASTARDMCSFVDASPTPYHACATATERLRAAGFRALGEIAAWDQEPGGWYVQRGGSLVAWHLPESLESSSGFRILGAHTDSPNLRIKPRPDRTSAGFRQLGVEVYGGALLNSWLDRDLGLAGRVFLRPEDPSQPVEVRLFRLDRPLLRVPQLAIHLHAELREKGLLLNKQRHMAPVWGLESSDERSFAELLSAELDLDSAGILAWEAMCHDLTPSTLAGWNNEFVNAPRLDNLCSSFCSIQALLEHAASSSTGGNTIAVASLFDHEEVGSTSRSGADGPLLPVLLERCTLARGGTREDHHRAIAGSFCVSADMAHATHPNYVERHEPEHHLLLNAGPVIKLNANLRYASEGGSEALFQAACEQADVPFQKWVNRTDLACGSTIGPATASALGVATVDVGNPQLSMHSAREMCGAADPAYMIAAMTSVLKSPGIGH